MSLPTALTAISEESLEALFTAARTANTFTDEPVPVEDLHRIYDLVKMGPTAMNLQSLRVLFICSEEAKQRLVAHMSEGNRAKTLSAPVTAVLAADNDFHEFLTQTFPHFAGAKDSFADETRRVTMARNQAWLAAGYFMLAVRALGYAAGPMAGFKAADIDAEFFGDSTWRSFCVVNIGKPGPDAWRERLPRLSFDQAARIL